MLQLIVPSNNQAQNIPVPVTDQTNDPRRDVLLTTVNDWTCAKIYELYDPRRGNSRRLCSSWRFFERPLLRFHCNHFGIAPQLTTWLASSAHLLAQTLLSTSLLQQWAVLDRLQHEVLGIWEEINV